MNALGKTMIVRHPVNRQILDRDQIKLVDDAATVLVGEVAPSPARSLMYACHDLAPLGAFWRPLLLLAEAALRLGECVFFASEEAWVGDLLPVTEGGEGLQPHVNADLLPRLKQGRWLGALTGETDVPFARAAPADRRRLGNTFHWAVQNELDKSNIGDTDALVVYMQPTANRHLREGEAIVAARATKAGIARFFACFAPTEVGLEGQINAHRDVLQYLRVNTCQCGSFGLERWQGPLLVVQAYCLLSLLPSHLALGEEMVIQPAALLQLLSEEVLLLLGRIQAVLERLTHSVIVRLRHAYSQVGLIVHPPAKARGFLAYFL